MIHHQDLQAHEERRKNVRLQTKNPIKGRGGRAARKMSATTHKAVKTSRRHNKRKELKKGQKVQSFEIGTNKREKKRKT